MKPSGIAGVAAVGVAGLVAGALAAWALMGPGAGTPAVEAPAVSRSAPSEAESDPAPAPAAARRAAPTAREGAPPEEEQGARMSLGEIFEGEVRTAADLEPRFDAALDSTISLDDLGEGASAEEVERALSERTLQATAKVNAAADAHLEFARSAPRGEAVAATAKAADLYQHLSDVLVEAPIPGHLPEDEAAIRRATAERMSESYARRAASLRAGGLPR